MNRERKRPASCGSLVHWPLLLLVLAVLLPGAAAAGGAPGAWVTLKGCEFEPDEYYDGDSFHVRSGRKEFIFRLYFVDAPETDDRFPDRNREQARYFGVTLEQNRRAGGQARAFAGACLKKPFVVRTRWQDAMGRSRLPRYYALVDVGGRDLGEWLVSQGWARAKGEWTTLPDGGTAKSHMARLRKIEDEARGKRRGVWAHSKNGAKR